MSQTINVNITPGLFMPTLFYSQGDIGRPFEIHLTTSDGTAIPTGVTAKFEATKPSGLGFSESVTISGSTVAFNTTETMTNEHGRVPAQIRLTKSGVDIGTARFWWEGEAKPHPEGTTDGDLDHILPKYVSVAVTTLSAGQDATYSYNPTTNTATFGIPKGADGSLSSSVLAPTYSSSATYAVGDYVYYNGDLYRCTTAITTAEAWTSGHWTQVALAPEVADLKDDISLVVEENADPIYLTINTNGYYNPSGVFVSDSNRQYAYVDVNEGENYSLTTQISSALIPAIEFFEDTTFVSYLKTGTGVVETLTDYRFTIPSGVNKLIVQSSAKKSDFTVVLKKLTKVSKYGDTVDALDEAVFETYSQDVEVPLTINTDGYYNPSGSFVSDSGRKYAVITGVAEGEVYKLSTYIRSTQIPAIEFFNGNLFVSYLKNGSGTAEFLTDYEFAIPSGVNKLIVQSSDSSVTPLLYKTISAVRTTFYKREDMPFKKFGVRWSIADADDLGSRCFDAESLSSTIGVGSTDGESDFDNIYPWSEIKRCNIKTNANGAPVVTFEGETGFALDGTNGDVFVRIPKFYVEKYIEDGYEYRIVSASGTTPHKAFIENGVELDEIFVGAFEGYSDNSVLKSIGGVIPSSNMVADDFLSLAKANGNNYSLYDMRCVDAIWTLIAVEFGCRNTNQIFGYGWADFLQPTNDQYGIPAVIAASNTNTLTSSNIPAARKAYMPIGSNVTICKESQTNVIAQRKLVSVTADATYDYFTFDGDPIDIDTTCFIGSAGCTTNFCESAPTGALSWHTGRANWINGSNTRNPVRYRWIENLVGSLWHFLPDVLFKGRQMYVCDNMMDYDLSQLSNAYKPIGALLTKQESNGEKSDIANANYWVSKLLNDVFAKGSCFGNAYDTSLLSTQAFGGYYYLWDSSDPVVIVNGGGFDHLYRCNMLTHRAWVWLDNKWYLYGARLMYKHIN